MSTGCLRGVSQEPVQNPLLQLRFGEPFSANAAPPSSASECRRDVHWVSTVCLPRSRNPPAIITWDLGCLHSRGVYGVCLSGASTAGVEDVSLALGHASQLRSSRPASGSLPCLAVALAKQLRPREECAARPEAIGALRIIRGGSCPSGQLPTHRPWWPQCYKL